MLSDLLVLISTHELFIVFSQGGEWQSGLVGIWQPAKVSPPQHQIHSSLTEQQRCCVGPHKGLEEAKIHYITCSSLLHQRSCCVKEGHQISQVPFALCKAMWLPLITSLSSLCLDTASRRIWSMILPDTEIYDWLMVPRVLFLPFLKSGVIFPFF